MLLICNIIKKTKTDHSFPVELSVKILTVRIKVGNVFSLIQSNTRYWIS